MVLSITLSMLACFSMDSVLQLSDLRKEVKEKEAQKQQMKEGLREALDEMTKLKDLLQVQHLLSPKLK